MNKKYKCLKHFLELLLNAQIVTTNQQFEHLGSYPLLNVSVTNWEKIFQIAANLKYRFVGIWARNKSTEPSNDKIEVTACLEYTGEHLFLRTEFNYNSKIAAITPYYVGANRLERHIQDMFGIVFADHPDHRRWSRHQAWLPHQYPLRNNFALNVKVATDNSNTPADASYPFLKVLGSGVYEIPVGPVHAGIIEPGHFRFQVAGEDIINLEEHLGYVHKGIEKIAEGKDVKSLIKLAGRISGDCTVAHAWTACRACENAYNITIPKRAAFLRAVMVERERIANHLGDFAAICNDLGFSFAYYQFTRLKELCLRLNAKIFKHRFMMDCIIPGGVTVDLTEITITEMQNQISMLKTELSELYLIIEDNSSLHDRLKNTGVLTLGNAHNLGALGYVGRASGLKFDLRVNAPYSPYDEFKVRVPIYNTGDVLARTRIRAQEILVSLDLISELLQMLPSSPINMQWPKLNYAAEGIGLVESWRGEILTYVCFNKAGLVERFFPRDPSWFSWPALEQLVLGNIVPDFPVCNKSINGSYSGVDL
jgi:Ni,Fe-hydrogenase III large subunit/NADH:ubiquinone oxidoreductase subunit C